MRSEPAWPEPALPPELGRHDPPPLRPVPSTVVATWPVGTFVENLAPLPTGDVVVSVLSRSALEVVSPDGSRRVLASTPAPPAGIVTRDDVCFVLVGEPGTGPYQVLRVGLDGEGTEWVSVPDARFLNGFALVIRAPGTRSTRFSARLCGSIWSGPVMRWSWRTSCSPSPCRCRRSRR